MKAGIKNSRHTPIATIVWWLLALLGFTAQSSAETVRLYFDPATPQIAFAAGDIKTALEKHKHTVESHPLAALAKAGSGKKIVLAVATDPTAASLLSAQGGKGVGSLSAQAYALRTTTAPDLSYWVLGGDANGAMYGGLQLAEHIQFHDIGRAYDEEEAPFLKNRGIKFNLPLDKDSPTYYYGFKGTSHKLAVKDVWDLGFWQTWFDEMARHRYNVLSLWSPHPFTSMVNMEAEYPGIAIQGVTGFDAAGESIKVNDLSIDQKITYWRAVMKYGRERGFDTYLCNWNIFLSTAEGKHGLTHATENEKTKVYLRKCVMKLFQTYPELKGFGITVGERMGELDVKQREEWAWDAFGKGVMQYAQENPHRDIVFIHRQHDGNIDHILKHFAPLNDLPNVRTDLSCKYSEAHVHSTVTPSRWHRTGMEAGLAKHGIKSWLTVRNDDFYFLHWAEPQFVRDYISGFPSVDQFVTGFYIGADGWVFAKDFTSKNPYYKKQNALSIQRTWYMQKLWGRISYNPKTSDAFFKQHLAARFPEVSADALFEAWSSASGAIRRANEQVTGKWQFDADFWPELWTGDMWQGREGRYFSVNDTKEATPFAGSKLASLRETAEAKVSSKISAWANIEQIDALSARALALLATLQPGANTELQLTLKDLTAQAHLGQYNAEKFRAVIYDLQGEKQKALQAMSKAYGAWRRYTDLMDELYIGVDLQRNRDFADWHAHDKTVLQDYHNLGGVGEPAHGEPATARIPPADKDHNWVWEDRAPRTGKADKPAGEKLLWYRQPAHVWTEALPLGSGRLGAMIFGGVADERIQLNVDSLWDGAPLVADNPQALERLPEVRRLLFEGKSKEASDLAAQTILGNPRAVSPYQSLGELYLEAPGLEGASAYTRSLDLAIACAAVSYQSSGVTHTRESFASAVDDVIATRFTASTPSNISLRFTLKRLQDAKPVTDPAHPHIVFLEGHIGGGKQPDRMRFHAAARVVTEGGSVKSENGVLTVSDADSVTLLIAAATDFPGFGKGPADPSIDTKKFCVETLERAAKKSFADLKAAHIKEHQAFFNRASLAIPSPAEASALPTDERLARFKRGEADPALAALYYDFGRYLLIGSSRPGTLPANLQGIWNWQLKPAWNADFHTNINLQMNYWPAHLTGLSDCELPLIDLIESLIKPGTRTAKSTYGARGWTVHHLTDAWGRTAPADGVHGVWPVGGAWLAAHPWQHYLFTQDKTFLRQRAWPIMRGAAEFILDFLIEAPAGSSVAGRLVTNPSHSPENKFLLPDGSTSVFTYGATMDLQIIRELLENCIAAEKILGTDVAFRAHCEDALRRLAPVRIARDGRLMEWIEEYPESDKRHRHVSHLYGLFPANQITPSTPDFFLAARKSLDVRGDGATGWSLAWKINLWARLRDGDRAHTLLSNLLRDKTLPNLFDTHPPFQIDGNFGATAAIAEMLVQSHVPDPNGGHFIDLLPALPSAWPAGAATGLHARGAITVDLHWKEGKLSTARITARQPGKYTIRYGDKTATRNFKSGEALILDITLNGRSQNEN